jgi:hypothetical protein
MKKLARPAAAMVIVASLGACSTDPTGNTPSTLIGAGIGAIVADQLGANDLGIALSAILGATAGQAINTNRTGGCVMTGTANRMFNGGHVFQNQRTGQFIQCPVVSVANANIVQGLYDSPNWRPVQATYQQPYRTNTLGNNGNRGPRITGFGY